MQRALELTAPRCLRRRRAGAAGNRKSTSTLATALPPHFGGELGWITRAQMPVALHRMRATLTGSVCGWASPRPDGLAGRVTRASKSRPDSRKPGGSDNAAKTCSIAISSSPYRYFFVRLCTNGDATQKGIVALASAREDLAAILVNLGHCALDLQPIVIAGAVGCVLLLRNDALQAALPASVRSFSESLKHSNIASFHDCSA